MPKFTFCGELEHKTTALFFFPWISIQSLSSTPEKIANIWRILITRWKKRHKVWSRATSPFKWRFRSRRRRRRCCLSSFKKWRRADSNLIALIKFVKCWQFFLESNSKRLYRSSGKEKESSLVFTSSTKRRSRVVMAKKCTKKRDARAELLFCQSEPIAVLSF